jgi:uncharacterized damage-inducible protein DinB
MLSFIKSLVAHNGDATELMLQEVLASAGAAADEEIQALCSHLLVSSRFWSAAIREVPFDLDRELRVVYAPRDHPGAFRQVHAEMTAWLDGAAESDCVRPLVHPLIPGGGCSVAEAFTQVCLHSHGHRAQLMKMLRRHGVEPAPHDFIVWLARRRITTP